MEVRLGLNSRKLKEFSLKRAHPRNDQTGENQEKGSARTKVKPIINKLERKRRIKYIHYHTK